MNDGKRPRFKHVTKKELTNITTDLTIDPDMLKVTHERIVFNEGGTSPLTVTLTKTEWVQMGRPQRITAAVTPLKG